MKKINLKNVLMIVILSVLITSFSIAIYFNIKAKKENKEFLFDVIYSIKELDQYLFLLSVEPTYIFDFTAAYKSRDSVVSAHNFIDKRKNNNDVNKHDLIKYLSGGLNDMLLSLDYRLESLRGNNEEENLSLFDVHLTKGVENLHKIESILDYDYNIKLKNKDRRVIIQYIEDNFSKKSEGILLTFPLITLIKNILSKDVPLKEEIVKNTKNSIETKICSTLNTWFLALTTQDKKWIYEEWMSRESIYRCELFAKAENEKNNVDCSLDFYQDEFGSRIYFNESWWAPYFLSKDGSWYHFLNFSQFSKLNNEKTKELVIRFKKEENKEFLDKEWLISISNNISNDKRDLGEDWIPKIYSKNNTNDCYISYEIKWKSVIWTMFFSFKEKWNIFYKKVVDKWYSIDYMLITKSEDVSESIQDLDLFISNTKINTEAYKETVQVKTTTKKPSTNTNTKTKTNTNTQQQSNDYVVAEKSTSEASEIFVKWTTILKTCNAFLTCSLNPDNCPSECRQQ